MKLISDERQRQVSQEGWESEHDDGHNSGEMADAAAAYALGANEVYESIKAGLSGDVAAPKCWPWEDKWWKPSIQIRMLSKAGALIAAEIDRLLRAAPSTPSAPEPGQASAAEREEEP